MGKTLRVLLIDDSEDDALLLVRELGKAGHDPVSERVWTAAGMQSALYNQIWDVVICDYVLPGFGGTAALELLKKSGMDLPFIMVSGKMGEETAVEVMKAGAHRPYRAALGMDKAIDEITRNREVLYDPRVVDACISVLPEVDLWSK